MSKATKRYIRRIQKWFPGRTIERVRDARTPLRFRVTKRHCGNAEPRDPNGCAGACALDDVDGIDGAAVGRWGTLILRGKTVWRYRNSPLLRREIAILDDERAFATGEYVLTAPRTNALGRPRDMDRRPKGGSPRPNGKRLTLRSRSDRPQRPVL